MPLGLHHVIGGTLKSGETLWRGLVAHYNSGAERAAQLRARWATLRGKVDDERFDAVAAKLQRQADEARAWADKCLRYFQQFSKRELKETK